MTDMNAFHYTDNVHDVLALYVNRLMDSTLRSEYKNIETLAADRELTDADAPIQRFDCDGSDRIVKMPVEDAVDNHPFVLVNASVAADTITVKNNAGTATLNVLTQGEMCLMLPKGDGTYRALIADAPADGTIYGRKDHAWVMAGGGGLTNANISPTTADITLSVNTRYFVDASGLTADRALKFPSGSDGDQIEIRMVGEHASYACVLRGDTSVNLEGLTATEWDRLWHSGMALQFVYRATDGWRVMSDNRNGLWRRITSTGIASFDFQGIPQYGKSLELRGPLRSNVASTADTLESRFNNDSAGNYDWMYWVIYHNAQFVTAESINAGATSMRVGNATGNTATANLFGQVVLNIENYVGANYHHINNNAGFQFGTATGQIRAQAGVGTHKVASAINRVTVFPGTGTQWVTGSWLELRILK